MLQNSKFRQISKSPEEIQRTKKSNKKKWQKSSANLHLLSKLDHWGHPNKGYFILKNLYTAKLLTGSKDNGLTVKPAVYFNKLTKEFDFSAALPKGVKVNSIFLFITKYPIFE